jgi:hypothetical protein
MHDDVSGGEQLENAGPDGNDGPGGTNGNTGSPSQREPETARSRRPLVIAAFVAAAVAFTAVARQGALGRPGPSCRRPPRSETGGGRAA